MKNKSAGSKLLHFVSLTDSFPYAKSDSCKTIETSLFNVNGDSLPGPLIIETFEKQPPGFHLSDANTTYRLAHRSALVIAIQVYALFYAFS